MQNYYKIPVLNYITQLPRAIRLDAGERQMTLTEVHYPCLFLSVHNDETIDIYTQPHEETIMTPSSF